ncbi:MAG: hypothetical protein FWD89_04050 [Firmicutes bacterium]|nr:hypothetical protein [Bacillota bacterium]MCL2771456.1 hypothetical protein [Bacillota bacterium]
MINNPALKELAQVFKKRNARLYAVGGSVRNYFLGEVDLDIDVASALTPDEVKEILSGSSYVVNDGSKKFGTVIITKGLFKAEHTTFRTECYAGDGSHKPTEVAFTKDIEQDSRRRDFTINAIYNDLVTDEYVDHVGGISDAKKRILRSIRDPDEMFAEDALRVLRFIRFKVMFNLTPVMGLWSSAKKHAPLLKNISSERIQQDIHRTLFSDKSNLRVQQEALSDFNKMGISKYLFGKDLRMPQYSVRRASAVEILYINRGKNLEEMADFFTRNKTEKLSVIKAIKLVELFKREKAVKSTAMVAKNYNEIKMVFSIIRKEAPKHIKKMEHILTSVEQGVLITSNNQINIKGDEMIDLGIEPVLVEKVKDMMFEEIVEGRIENKKTNLILFVQQVAEKENARLSLERAKEKLEEVKEIEPVRLEDSERILARKQKEEALEKLGNIQNLEAPKLEDSGKVMVRQNLREIEEAAKRIEGIQTKTKKEEEEE